VTTREEISAWFDEGAKLGSDYMIVMTDTFDWDDYPSYYSGDNITRHVASKNFNMQKVMEVYDLRLDRESQLNQHRCRADLT